MNGALDRPQMEMGSSSSSSSNSSDSLNGLKFGHKIYFEDVGIGGSAAVAAGGGGQRPPLPKRGRSGAVQGGQPPRCQVEGCKVDLSDAKGYYSRHKVCGMHSKSPRVIVGGLEQRFCQQCSRFHQLPEFDQEKKSCRRRLAGHNERRRKLPPGSLLSSRYGHLSSSVFVTENSRGGGFLMDFTAFPRISGKDPWPTTRATGRVSSANHQPTATWHSESENLPSDLLLQSGAAYSSPSLQSGAGCALSLLSNQQPWGSSRDGSLNIRVNNNFLNADDGEPPHVVQSAATTHGGGATINHFSSTSWGFKGNEVNSSSHEILPDLGLHQYSGGLDARQSGKQYMELEQSRAFDSSTQHMHWSL